MAFVQLFIPSENARSTVSALGEAGSVEFLDVQPSILSQLTIAVEQRHKCLSKKFR